MAARKLSKREIARKHGFRSGLEDDLASQIRGAGLPVLFETFTIRFTRPAKQSRYTPDLLLPNGVIIESKGRFLSDDRVKHLLIKEQFPDLDIRLVFSNARQKIAKGSKTTCGDWCDKHGFPYSHKSIPQAWIDEPPNEVSLQAIKELNVKK